ncbi:MAG: amino acid adenylation domain-containing protein [Candidatus Aminicenantes bacterium]|jgi:amino acid adenylation domain-containing protein
MEKIDKKNIEDILALTPMQEGMLFHYLKDPDSDHYFEQFCLEISGLMDIHWFEKAWNVVIETNEMLRTLFRWEQREFPVQVILKQSHLHGEYHDFSDKDSNEKNKLLEAIKTKDRKKKFNLRDVPFRVHLCKTGKARYEMIISYHHILYDGWSNGILLKEFFEIYDTLSGGEPTDFPGKNPKPKFKTFIQWLQNRDTDKEKKFWQKYLNGFDTPTGFSIKRSQQQKKNSTGNIHLPLAKNFKDKIEDFVRAHKITWASLLYCSWGILLQKYNNCEDAVFGTTVSGRSARTNVKGIEHLVGLLINTIPLRVQAHPGEKIAALIYRINETLREREEYEHTSLVKIKEVATSLNGAANGAFFDSLVVIENYPIDNQLHRSNNRLSIHSYSMVESTNYDLTLGIMLFDEIAFNFNYKEEAFDKEDIERLSGHFLRILESMSKYPGKAVYDIEMISGIEKNKLLYELNHTDIPYREVRSLHQLFEEQVERTPDQIAVIAPLRIKYRSYGTYRTYISYRELNEKSTQLAHFLVERGVEPEIIVGIMANPSLEMAVGLLAILKAGAAYLPIDPEYPEDRINYMLKDSNVGVLVTTPKLQVKVEVKERFIEKIDICNLSSFSTSTSTCQVSPANLAYVIYTSGSTGRPKGVMIEHGNIFNTIYWRTHEYKLTVNDKVLQLFSFAFDGFITSFFTPIVSGSQVMLLTGKHTQEVTTVKDVIISHRISHFICTPSFYSVLLGTMSPDELSGLKLVTLAGEELKSSLLSRSKQLNHSLEIVNEYGPTENSVATTFLRDINPFGAISIGKPIANTKVYILDKTNALLPLGVPGELCISGKGVARGYLNRPGLTAEKFVLAHSSWLIADRKVMKKAVKFPMSYQLSAISYIYKTGDWARWLQDGNIEFLGRIDHQVKIRGFRIEPGEIEGQLLTHEKVNDVAVVVKSDKGEDQYLCAYIVSEKEFTVPELRGFLSDRVPDYMIPAYFIFLEKIPLTTNGKVDKRALPDPGLTTQNDFAPPGDEIEEKLVKLWSEVLGRDPKHPLKIGIDDSFFELGGHSLKATALLVKIHKIFNVKVPMDTLFSAPTVRELAQYVKRAQQHLYTAIKKVEKREYYPLSTAQKRLYITCHWELEGVGYNVQNLVEIEGNLSRQRVEKTFRRLIARHESLRTSFRVVRDEPVQMVHDRVEFEIEYHQSLVNSHWSLVKEEERFSSNCQGRGEVSSPIRIEMVIRKFIRPFDLGQAPLLRVGVIELLHTPTALSGHLLIMDMHHIIADAFSMGLFVHQFKALYREETLPPLSIQYKDFVLWQAELTGNPQDREALLGQEKYWLKEFEGEVPLLNLPLDYPRPTLENYEGAVVFFQLDREITTLIKDIALEEDVTVFMMLLAAFNVLLSKICDQENIPVGTPVAGRRHADLQQVIGLFVNMLVLKNQPSGSKTFRGFLREIKKKTLAAYENQDYPYEELVDQLSIKRNQGRNPLFDVVLVWEDPDLELGELENTGIGEEKLKLKPFKYEKINAPFDLILTGSKTNEKMSFFINYRTSLFKRESIEQITRGFRQIISGLLKEPDIKLEDIAVSYNLLEANPADLLEDQGDFGF